jgi:hypothetical protein
MAIQEAMIVLSLLGCDDSGTQCHYLRTAQQRFETIDACRDASGLFLKSGHEEDYPTVVAICSPVVENAGQPVPPESPTEGTPVESAGELSEPGFLKRVATAIADVTPSRETIEKPIGAAAGGVVKVGNALVVGVTRVAEAVNPF